MFSLFLVAGVVISLGWLALRAPAGRQILAVDAGAGVLLGCLVGARSGYVLANWPYYAAHLAETPQFWLGGLSGVGAALGGTLALPLLAWLTKQKLSVLADQMLPLLAVLPAAGWLGCWLDGCAYGLPAPGAWWGLTVVDEWGQVERRFPLQLVGALLALSIPWLLEAWSARMEKHTSQPAKLEARTDGRGRLAVRPVQPSAPPGQVTVSCLIGLALTLFGLSFLRGDPTLLWNGLRLETWGSLGLLGLSGIGLGWVQREMRVKK